MKWQSTSFIFVRKSSSISNIALVALLGTAGTGILMEAQKICSRLGVQRSWAMKAQAKEGVLKNDWPLPKEISSSCGSSSVSASFMSLSRCFPRSSDPSVSISWFDVFDCSDSWVVCYHHVPLCLNLPLCSVQLQLP